MEVYSLNETFFAVLHFRLEFGCIGITPVPLCVRMFDRVCVCFGVCVCAKECVCVLWCVRMCVCVCLRVCVFLEHGLSGRM